MTSRSDLLIDDGPSFSFKSRGYRWVAIGVIGLVVIVGLAYDILPSGAATSGTQSKSAEFSAWVSEVENDLSSCEVASLATEQALLAVQQDSSGSPLSESTVLAAGAAAPVCDNKISTSSSGVAGLASDTPPSSVPGLSGVPNQLSAWTQNNVRVTNLALLLLAAGNLSDRGVATSALQNEYSSNQQAQKIETTVKTAAQNAGLKNFKGLDLLEWTIEGPP